MQGLRKGIRALRDVLDRPGALTVGIILLVAFALRMIYAYELPMTADESNHIRLAQKISLHPGRFNLPLGNHMTNHPMLAVYLAAAARWLGGSKPLFGRAIFVLLGMVGLVGLLRLTRTFFGPRVAVLALAIAALDRHLICYAPRMLEPVLLCLVPWTILVMYNCVALQRRRQWLLLGLLFGTGYLIYELVLVLLLPLGLYVLFSRKTWHVLKTPHVYLGGVLFFVLISHSLVWNLMNQGVNFKNNMVKVGSLGLGPRVLLLYIGDLLICLKDTSWIVMTRAHKMYMPTDYIPCQWVVGLVYLGCVVYSCRFWKDQKIKLLLLVVFGVALPVSVVNAREAWNEFWWASMTLFPVIALTAHIMDKATKSRAGLAAAAAGFLFVFISTGHFLVGPKYGYASPCWEKAFVGRVVGFLYMDRHRQAWNLANRAIQEHPDSAIAYYFRGRASASVVESKADCQKALELDPYNPLATLARVEVLRRRRDWSGARNLLRGLLANNHDYDTVRYALAESELHLKNYREAEKQALQAARINPSWTDTYMLLFRVRAAMGKTSAAVESLARYAARQWEPHEVFVSNAWDCALRGDMVMARACYDKALEIKPDLPTSPSWLTPSGEGGASGPAGKSD